MTKTLNSTGLKLKPSYIELLDYLQRDPDKIHYPNRKAIQLRNSFQLSQLDGIGNLEMERTQRKQMIEQQKEQILKQFALDFNLKQADVKAYVENKGIHPVQLGQRAHREMTSVREDDTMPADIGAADEVHVADDVEVAEGGVAGVEPMSHMEASTLAVSQPTSQPVAVPQQRRQRALATSSNSGGVVDGTAVPVPHRRANAGGYVKLATDIIADTGEVVGALGSAAGSALSATGSVAAGGAELISGAAEVATTVGPLVIGGIVLGGKAAYYTASGVAKGVRALGRIGRSSSSTQQAAEASDDDITGDEKVGYGFTDAPVIRAALDERYPRQRGHQATESDSDEEKREQSWLGSIFSKREIEDRHEERRKKVAGQASSDLSDIEPSYAPARRGRRHNRKFSRYDIGTPRRGAISDVEDRAVGILGF